MEFVLILFLAISATVVPQTNTGIVPPIELSGPEDDTFPVSQPVTIEADLGTLGGLDNLQARLFTARYVKELHETPGRLAIGGTPSGACWIFHSRIKPFDPKVGAPVIDFGQLKESEFRCAGGYLRDTECVVVVEKNGDEDPFLRILTGKIRPFFAHAYFFTVRARQNQKCSDGTPKIAGSGSGSSRKPSVKGTREAANEDTKPRCIEVVKSR